MRPTMSEFNPYAPPPQIEPAAPLPHGAKLYRPCPACGNTYAKQASYTWWGGALGPWLLTHVKCLQCQTWYNSKTGKSNNTAITIYIGVSAVIGLIAGVLIAFA
jgi:hypothetical protein